MLAGRAHACELLAVAVRGGGASSPARLVAGAFLAALLAGTALPAAGQEVPSSRAAGVPASLELPDRGTRTRPAGTGRCS